MSIVFIALLTIGFVTPWIAFMILTAEPQDQKAIPPWHGRQPHDWRSRGYANRYLKRECPRCHAVEEMFIGLPGEWIHVDGPMYCLAWGACSAQRTKP